MAGLASVRRRAYGYLMFSRCCLLFAFVLLPFRFVCSAPLESGEVRTWQMQEIHLLAEEAYDNPYVEVRCWIDLKGPGFSERVCGFWDGGRSFKVRFVANAPGAWTWKPGSNQPDDAGLNGGAGNASAAYRWIWYDPRSGEWLKSKKVRATVDGEISVPRFPGGERTASRDWAAKVVTR